MHTRKLGGTSLELSVIGFGAWALGGGGWKFAWGPQDDNESIAAIHRALDLGVNWIDTAAVYGFGYSEEIVGCALAGLSRKPFVATKCCRLRDPEHPGEIIGSLKRDSIRRELEGSLKRLRLDAVDLYQMHWPKPEEDLEEGWAAMNELVKEGKARYAGVCNFSVAQLERIGRLHPVASLQPPYSMLVRGVEKDLLSYCQAHEIGVVVYSPMQKGLLTGAFTRERVAALAANDHRRNDPMFKDPQFGATLELVEGLRPIAARHKKTVAQLALAWTLRRPEVASAIVGVRRPAQIEETVGAGDWKLPARDIQEIERLLEKREKALAG